MHPYIWQVLYLFKLSVTRHGWKYRCLPCLLSMNDMISFSRYKYIATRRITPPLLLLLASFLWCGISKCWMGRKGKIHTSPYGILHGREYMLVIFWILDTALLHKWRTRKTDLRILTETYSQALWITCSYHLSADFFEGWTPLTLARMTEIVVPDWCWLD